MPSTAKILRLASIVLSLSILAVLGIALTYLVAYDHSPRYSRFFMWFFSLMAIAVIPISRYMQSHELFIAQLRSSRRLLDKRKVGVQELLLQNLRPRIDSREGLADVCGMAAKVIMAAHKKKQNEYRYITFYGAASLAIP